MANATAYGHPLVRAMWIHYPSDELAQTIGTQFMLGDQFIAAPALDANATSVSVYLPPGGVESWVDLWTGRSYDAGAHVTLPATLGSPPLLFAVGSEAGEKLRVSLSVLDAGACADAVG